MVLPAVYIAFPEKMNIIARFDHALSGTLCHLSLSEKQDLARPSGELATEGCLRGQNSDGENNLPLTQGEVSRGDGEGDRTQQSFFVPADEIRANDYDLSINKYKKTEYVAVEYPPTSEILQNIDDLESEIQKELAELKKILGE